MIKDKLKEVEPPVGQFIFDQADIEAFEAIDGYYYHYTKVIALMKRYAQSELSEANKEIQRLKDESVREHDHLDKKVTQLVEANKEIERLKKDFDPHLPCGPRKSRADLDKIADKIRARNPKFMSQSEAIIQSQQQEIERLKEGLRTVGGFIESGTPGFALSEIRSLITPK